MKLYIHVSFPTKSIHNGTYTYNLENEDITLKELLSKLHSSNNEINPSYVKIKENLQ